MEREPESSPHSDISLIQEWVRRDAEGRVELWLQREHFNRKNGGTSTEFARYHWQGRRLASVDMLTAGYRQKAVLTFGAHGEPLTIVTQGDVSFTVTFTWEGTFAPAPLRRPDPSSPFDRPNFTGEVMPDSLADVTTAWGEPFLFSGVVRVKDLDGDIRTAHYANGLRVASERPRVAGGTYRSTLRYDEGGQLLEARTTNDDASEQFEERYEYESGRLVRLAQTFPPMTTHFEYSVDGRLQRETDLDKDGKPNSVTTYGDACPPDDPVR